MNANELTKAIMVIQKDTSLTDAEKAKKRQELMSASWKPAACDSDSEEEEGAEAAQEEKPAMFDENLKCAMCMELCVRPITAPCQHNFCLGCFKKWVAQGKKTCPTCRNAFPAKFAANPRINTALTTAIRMAKAGNACPSSAKNFDRMKDKDRPDEAFTTDRAVRAGRANASSGRIMVNVPGDHFGPIPPSADPRGLGVRVGESWKDRLDCRQWGAHFPHVAGIAGQSGVGAQSVVLSGGYEDDRDEGEWFMYTGSGGRDLSGNKRTCKVQSFDQKFENMNKALLLSCQKGLPVRVVRSHKEKRSAYAPTEDEPVRYDGIYRIARCWRKSGAQGMLMCRYLFIRCDNEPAPWSSEETGDKPWGPDTPLPAEAVKEIKEAKGTVYETGKGPWWNWSADKGTWGWSRDPPVSQKQGGDPNSPKKMRRKVSEQERALREMACLLCKGVLQQPVSTACGHHFCKPCLDNKFQGCGDTLDREATAGRALRVRKVVKPCPACKQDIADFLATAQVNRDMQAVIERLQEAVQKARDEAAKADSNGADADADQATDDAEEAAAEQPDASSDLTALTAAADAKAGAAGTAASGTVAVPRSSAGSMQENNGSAANAGAAAAAAVAATSPKQAQPVTDDKLSALCEEFTEFDKDLIAGMLEDQSGDAEEVHASLRRMRRQQQAADRKAQAEGKKAAAAAQSSAEAASNDADAEDGTPAQASKGKKRGAANKAGTSKKQKA